jgi:hypothetical protein
MSIFRMPECRAGCTESDEEARAGTPWVSAAFGSRRIGVPADIISTTVATRNTIFHGKRRVYLGKVCVIVAGFTVVHLFFRSRFERGPMNVAASFKQKIPSQRKGTGSKVSSLWHWFGMPQKM